jgi:putative ubiquitin-RnfH superfamily antitoxin RatB of RatAB toxin-antitoxin module
MTPAAATIVVTVAWVSPAAQELVTVEMPSSATAADAIARSGLVDAYRLDCAKLGIAIFGRRAAPDTALRDGDRVEITRPLVVDAKSMRRARARTPRGAPSARASTSRRTG